jgi:hypothetical protein
MSTSLTRGVCARAGFLGLYGVLGATVARSDFHRCAIGFPQLLQLSHELRLHLVLPAMRTVKFLCGEIRIV